MGKELFTTFYYSGMLSQESVGDEGSPENFYSSLEAIYVVRIGKVAFNSLGVSL
jgi:hypothetical protein